MRRKESIIEKRKRYIKQHGFKNLSRFAFAIGDSPTNVHKVVKGLHRPSIEKMFAYAMGLHAPIEEVLWLFYEDEMKKCPTKSTTDSYLTFSECNDEIIVSPSFSIDNDNKIKQIIITNPEGVNIQFKNDVGVIITRKE